MKKLSTGMVVLMMALTLAMAPGLALADSHAPDPDLDHGPMPIAVVGSLFGGVFWLVSTPFCLLIAPTHILDSFDTLVVDPLRVAVGSD